jgi:myo-inositol-1(or 4)-monophosphatase
MQSQFDTGCLRERAEAAMAIARSVGNDVAAFRAEAAPEALGVENKGMQDFVTVADRRAESVIRKGLAERFPDDAFLGEEGGGTAGDKGTWIVDPIDGTTNFIRGFRHWGVSIAFVQNGEILVGVIYDAAQSAVFSAIRGSGAFKDGKPIRAAGTTDPARAIAILGHSRRTDFEDYLAISRQLYERGIDYRRMGAAAIGLVRVAEGVADLYYERHLSVWDVMAGALIAREAGAQVELPSISSLIEKGGSIIACAPGLVEEMAFLFEIEKSAIASA